jgi:hypothetical protein
MPEGFTAAATAVSFNITIPPAQISILGISPRTASLLGGSEVRITVTGLYVNLSALEAPPQLPNVTFGAETVAPKLVVSDLDASVLSVQLPRVSGAGIVVVKIGEDANFTFAYGTPGVGAQSSDSDSASANEVDPIAGGTVNLRLTGMRNLRSEALACSIDGVQVPVQVGTPSASGDYEIVVTVPPIQGELSQPLTPVFVECKTDSEAVYAEIFYRSPPRATNAEFSPDGSRIYIGFDQATNGAGSVPDCAILVLADRTGSLGADPACAWIDDGKTLQIMLGRGVFAEVGELLYIVAGIVKSQNGLSGSNSRHTVLVEAPVALLPPRCTLRACACIHVYTCCMYVCF